MNEFEGLIGKHLELQYPTGNQYGGMKLSGLCVATIGPLFLIEGKSEYWNILDVRTLRIQGDVDGE